MAARHPRGAVHRARAPPTTRPSTAATCSRPTRDGWPRWPRRRSRPPTAAAWTCPACWPWRCRSRAGPRRSSRRWPGRGTAGRATLAITNGGGLPAGRRRPTVVRDRRRARNRPCRPPRPSPPSWPPWPCWPSAWAPRSTPASCAPRPRRSRPCWPRAARLRRRSWPTWPRCRAWSSPAAAWPTRPRWSWPSSSRKPATCTPWACPTPTCCTARSRWWTPTPRPSCWPPTPGRPWRARSSWPGGSPAPGPWPTASAAARSWRRPARGRCRAGAAGVAGADRA